MRDTIYGFCFLLFFFFGPVAAATLEPHCLAGNIGQFFTAINPDAPFDQWIRLRFKVHFGLRQDYPAVVFIQGGPGLPSMQGLVGNLPPDFTQILMDTRGTGCNPLRPSSLENRNAPSVLSTRAIVSDYVSLIRYLRLNNYFVYGTSYGSIVATELVSELLASQLPLPRGVILEGVLGRAFTPGEVGQGVYPYWANLKASMTPLETLSWQSRLQNHEVSPSTLEAFSQQMRGNGDGFPFLFKGWMNQNLRFERSHETRRLTGSSATSLLPAHGLTGGWDSTHVDPSQEPNSVVFLNIVCREITQETWGLQLYQDDLLPIIRGLDCSPIELNRPYDSRRFQIPVPIFYFSSRYEVVTPLFQTKYHFAHQAHPRKWLALFQSAAHLPLLSAEPTCAGPIWKDLLHGQSLSSQSFRGCQVNGNLYFPGNPVEWPEEMK